MSSSVRGIVYDDADCVCGGKEEVQLRYGNDKSGFGWTELITYFP